MGSEQYFYFCKCGIDFASAAAQAGQSPADPFGPPWVNYEIKQSFADGKGMLGIYIHNLKDPRTGLADHKGRNPFENIFLTNSNPRRFLSELYPTYDWVPDNGYANFASWVEAVAGKANR